MLICREGYWIDKLKPALNLNFPQYGMWEIHAEAAQIRRRKRQEIQLFQQCTETVDASFFDWRLPVLMADRGIDYKELAKITGMHPGTISKLKNNLPDRLELVTLTKLCKALKCQPGDLLTYIPVEGDGK
jgi:putative transcriptional regulator